MKTAEPENGTTPVQLGAPSPDAAEHASAREQDRPSAVDRPVDHRGDATVEAFERELARARAERRWVDADAIAQDIEEHRAARTAEAKIIDLGAARKARG